MNSIKVENERGLIRDTNSNAILNTDLDELHKHRAKMFAIHQKDNKIQELTSRIDNLELLIHKMIDK
jgi:hypothetical protein